MLCLGDQRHTHVASRLLYVNGFAGIDISDLALAHFDQRRRTSIVNPRSDTMTISGGHGEPVLQSIKPK